MRTVYTLSDWVVEKRSNGWFYTLYRSRKHAKWAGPYRSEASVSLMIARELRKEIKRRTQAQEA